MNEANEYLGEAMRGGRASRTGMFLAAAAFLLASGAAATAGTTVGGSVGTIPAVRIDSLSAIIGWSGSIGPRGSTLNFIQPTTGPIELNYATGGTIKPTGSVTSASTIWIVAPSGVTPTSFTVHASTESLHPATLAPSVSGAAQSIIASRTSHAPSEASGFSQPDPVLIARDGLIGFATSADATAPATIAPSVKLAAATMQRGSLPAPTLQQVLDNVINTCGIVEATSAAIVNGRVVLSGSGDGCR